jgi:tetratricopeptide (TPR) repeat protein
MFRQAQELQGASERIAAYRQLLAAYPDSEVSAQAQFMVGFIYSEELKNYDEAEKAFRLVLSRYGKSELAASAQWMVDHMRTEEAPDFVTQGADSAAGKSAPAPPGRRKTARQRSGATGKP